MVRRLINQNFVLIACIVTLHAFSWLIFYSIEDRSRPVLDLPISVSPAGRVVADINIKYFRGYDLNLVFDREGHSVEEILRDIGTTYFIGRDKYLDELQEFSWRERYLKNIEEYKKKKTGVPLTLRWQVFSVSPYEMVCQGEIETAGRLYSDHKEVFRSVPYFCSMLRYSMVPDGKYHFSAEIVNDTPELSGYKTRIRLSPSLAPDEFFISGGIVYLLILAEIILLLVLAFKGYKYIKNQPT
jgi:hypothetical protein